MKSALREAGYAFVAWAIPFGGSVCLFPLKRSNTPLFDSLMGVVLVVSTMGLGLLYFRRPTRRGSALAGLRVGILWMIANWVFDGLMFSFGPMKMSLAHYISDIGVAYFAIPAITLGLGMVSKTPRLTSLSA